MNHRTPGPLTVSDPIRRQLVRAHQLEGSPMRQHLPASAVADVEAALDVGLPDDLLAILISGSTLFCDRHRMSLDLLLPHQRAIQAAQGPADVFAVGEQPDRFGFYVIERRWVSPPFILEFDAHARSLAPWALEQWMERRVGDLQASMLLGGDEAAQARAGRVPSAADLASFQPHLT